MLGIYDISEAEKEFVISRKFGEELTQNAFYRKLEETNAEVAERFKESIAEAARLLEPSDIFVVSDTEATKERLVTALVKEGILKPMNPDYPNSYLYRSDPSDVAPQDTLSDSLPECLPLLHDRSQIAQSTPVFGT